MHFTDGQRQAIPGKRLLSCEEKRAQIKEWDLEVWSAFAPPASREVPKEKKSTIEYLCFCPHCAEDQTKKHKKKRGGIHDLTAWVFHHANGDGLGFYCASCKTKHPRVYEFLGGAGAEAAEEYAEKRLEIDAVGKGWYCPAPQRHKRQQEQEKRDRAAKYKERDARRKRENQIAYALREQEELKTAEPRTQPGLKGFDLPPEPSGALRAH